MPPPLIALWLARAFDAWADELAAGARPDLGRLLGLPDRSPKRKRRGHLQRERDRALCLIANALAGELKPWQRAQALAELLRNPTDPGPQSARGYTAGIRAEVLGKYPTSTRALYRIIVRPLT